MATPRPRNRTEIDVCRTVRPHAFVPAPYWPSSRCGDYGRARGVVPARVNEAVEPARRSFRPAARGHWEFKSKRDTMPRPSKTPSGWSFGCIYCALSTFLSCWRRDSPQTPPEVWRRVAQGTPTCRGTYAISCAPRLWGCSPKDARVRRRGAPRPVAAEGRAGQKLNSARSPRRPGLR